MFQKIRASDIFLLTVLLVSFYLLPYSINSIDSFVFYYVCKVDGHYPLLYPTFVRALRVFQSVPNVLLVIGIISYFILGLSLRYVVSAYTEMNRFWFYSFFFLINAFILFLNKGLYSESLFFSFLLIHLSASFKLIKSNKLGHYIVFAVSLFLLCLTRYIGVVSASFIVTYCAIAYIKNRSTEQAIKLLVLGLIVFGVYQTSIICEKVFAVSSGYQWISTEGRAATYRIVYANSLMTVEEKAQFYREWSAQSKSAIEDSAIKNLMTAEKADCWLPIYIRTFPHSNSQYHANQIFNRVCRTYMLIYNPALYKSVFDDMREHLKYSSIVSSIYDNSQQAARNIDSFAAVIQNPIDLASWKMILSTHPQEQKIEHIIDKVQLYSLYTLLIYSLRLLWHKREKRVMFVAVVLSFLFSITLMSIATIYLPRYGWHTYFLFNVSLLLWIFESKKQEQSLPSLISKQFAIGFILLFLLVLYIAWEVYWYNQIGLAFIKWHTHIVFAFFISSLIVLPFLILSRFKQNDFSKNLFTSATSLSFLLFLTEVFLCIFPLKKTSTEKITGSYYSEFYTGNNIFHSWKYFGGSHWVKSAEFEYFRKDNSLGFPDKEWQIRKPDNKIRILALGDSFTEGDGAPQDSAYPILLEKILGDRYEVMNAGTCGSDPIFNYYNLEKRLLHYKPEIVLQTISEHDLFYDISIRGGFERFVGDSTLKYNTPPVWESLYSISYTSRLAIDVMQKIKTDDYSRTPREVAKKNEIICDLLNRYEKLAKKNHFRVYIIFLPLKGEVKDNQYQFDFASTQNYISNLSHIKTIDLMPCYQTTMRPMKNYYWDQDGHHNSKGYQVMARCIAEELLAE